MTINKNSLEHFQDIDNSTKILVVNNIAICGFQEVDLTGGDNNESEE